METRSSGTELFRSVDEARRNLRHRAEFTLMESMMESALPEAVPAWLAQSMPPTKTDPPQTIVRRTVRS
jgi:hypothetical protein